jgi:hypothetical protein
MIDQALSDSKSKKYLNKILSKDGIKIKCKVLNPIREDAIDWIMDDSSSLRKYINFLPEINSDNLIDGLRKKICSIIEKEEQNEKSKDKMSA